MQNNTVFQPGETINFDTVQAEHTRLQQFIQALGDADLIVDLSGVKECDSAGLALMLEAKRLAKIADKPCRYRAVPEKVEKLARFCGIESIFLEA